MLRTFLFLLCWAAAPAADPLAMGVLGDSLSQRYAPLRPTWGAPAHSWTEILAEDGRAAFGSTTEPWTYLAAAAGRTTHEVLAGGQALALAEAIADGRVSTVVVQLGCDDLADWLRRGRSEPAETQARRTAWRLDAILALLAAAGPRRLIVCTLPSWSHAPLVRQMLTGDDLAQADRLAVQVNRALAAAADRHRAAVVDLDGLLHAWRIRPPDATADPLAADAFLADGVHPGPHLSARFADAVWRAAPTGP
jgi:phospholipase/lecithinase/hemolysin